MDRILQWKACYARQDGSIGTLYIGMPSEPLSEDLMDLILRWDADLYHFTVNAMSEEDRVTQAQEFFRVNHITTLFVRSLDDLIDSSSDS
ncbi:hypothetical protein [Pseudoduganella sp. RAF53_2]|uniref:hypothetical protein n=1 Tax=unclassified Pseudoduganella TaxID=2637179 RepID=UPI003F96471C